MNRTGPARHARWANRAQADHNPACLRGRQRRYSRSMFWREVSISTWPPTCIPSRPSVMQLQMSQVAAHADPRPPAHPEGHFPLPDGPQPRGDFPIVEHPEAAPDVVGRVPWQVGERRQGERGNTGGRRPLSSVIKQRPGQPLPGALPGSTDTCSTCTQPSTMSVMRNPAGRSSAPVITHRRPSSRQAASASGCHSIPQTSGLPTSSNICPAARSICCTAESSATRQGEHPCFSIAAQSPPSDTAHKALSRLSHHLVVAEARNDTQSTTRPRSDQLADRCSWRHAHSLAAESTALGDLAESRVLGGAWSCCRSHDYSHAEAWSTSVAICH